MNARVLILTLAALATWAGAPPALVRAQPAEDAPSDFVQQPGSGSPATQDPGLMEGGKMAKRTRSLDAQQEGALLDKGRIAEETLQRLQTLREAGNPHIPRSFLLSGIKERQDREKVNQALLAEDTTRMVLRHEGYAERVRDALSARKTDEEAQAPAAAAEPEKKSSRSELLAVFGTVLIVVAALVVMLHRRKVQVA